MGWGSTKRLRFAGAVALLATACSEPHSEAASSSPPAPPPQAPLAPLPATDAKSGQTAVRDSSYDLIPAPVLYDALQQRFGLKVRIPDSLKVCGPTYANSVRAVWTRLDGSDCESDGPFIGYHGDYVMEDLNPAKDALAYAQHDCSEAEWAPGKWRHAIAGLKTAMCRQDNSDGSFVITLHAVAGDQPAEKGGTIPRYAYNLHLGTTAERYDRDVAVFDDFLSRLELTDDAGACCGPLGQIPPPP